MSLSISSNFSALQAQFVLRTNEQHLASAADQLASGYRLGNSAIDPSGVAIYTSLTAQNSTLSTVVTDASNANVLLQQAAGGLQDVGGLLQRMGELATQAHAGINTGTADQFLNLEYQTLIQQIDQIATETTFKSTVMLDGSLSGAVALNTNTDNISAVPIFTPKTVFTIGATLPTDGQTISIGGATVTFSTNAAQTGRVLVGGTATATSANLAAFLNSTPNPEYAGFTFTNVAGALDAMFAGGLVNLSNNAITLSGAAGTYAGGVGATATIATGDGDNGLSINRTFATGEISDGTLLALSQGGLNPAGVKNNADFIGDVTLGGTNGFTATYTGTNAVDVTLQVGSYTYSGAITNTNTGTATVSLSGTDANGNSGGSFTITQSGLGATVNNQSDAASYARRLTTALGGVKFAQNRTISSYEPGGNIVADGVVTGSLQGTKFDITGSDLTNLSLGVVSVSAPVGGQTNAAITIVVNGDTYRSDPNLGQNLTAGSHYILTDTNNGTQTLGFTVGATGIQLATTDQAAAFQSALQTAFGLSSAGGGLVVQVGVHSDQTIAVNLASSTSAALGLAGTDITNFSNAADAVSLINSAVNTNGAQLAAIGAQQARFNYVISNLTSSIQNITAAASNYGTTDSASEATLFSSNQVQEQAGIAVLAQLNQLPENLLKLL